MTKLELINELRDVPDGAIIFIETGYGQTPTKSVGIDYSYVPRYILDNVYQDFNKKNISWDGRKFDATAVLIS